MAGQQLETYRSFSAVDWHIHDMLSEISRPSSPRHRLSPESSAKLDRPAGVQGSTCRGYVSQPRVGDGRCSRPISQGRAPSHLRLLDR